MLVSEPGVGAWCETCGSHVDRVQLDHLLFELAIRVSVRCHGLEAERKIGAEVLVAGVCFLPLVFFRLPLRALPPIAPPRERGRLLPPSDPARTIVWNVGPISTQQEAPC